MRLLLASQSPRRAALLRDAGIPFALGPAPDVDERPPAGPPGEVVQALAERKARAVAPKVPGRTVLTADTLVFFDGRPLGKPASDEEARAMLRALSGRAHSVCTGVALARAGDDGVRCQAVHHCAAVQVAVLTPERIDAYVATGEPRDKAGAYAIQGEAAAFVSCLPADRDCVIGLPVEHVRKLLADWGPLG